MMDDGGGRDECRGGGEGVQAQMTREGVNDVLLA